MDTNKLLTITGKQLDKMGENELEELLSNIRLSEDEFYSTDRNNRIFADAEQLFILKKGILNRLSAIREANRELKKDEEGLKRDERFESGTHSERKSIIHEIRFHKK